MLWRPGEPRYPHPVSLLCSCMMQAASMQLTYALGAVQRQDHGSRGAACAAAAGHPRRCGPACAPACTACTVAQAARAALAHSDDGQRAAAPGGVVIIYSRQQAFLLDDCKEMMVRVAMLTRIADWTCWKRLQPAMYTGCFRGSNHARALLTTPVWPAANGGQACCGGGCRTLPIACTCAASICNVCGARPRMRTMV